MDKNRSDTFDIIFFYWVKTWNERGKKLKIRGGESVFVEFVFTKVQKRKIDRKELEGERECFRCSKISDPLFYQKNGRTNFSLLYAIQFISFLPKTLTFFADLPLSQLLCSYSRRRCIWHTDGHRLFLSNLVSVLFLKGSFTSKSSIGCCLSLLLLI